MKIIFIVLLAFVLVACTSLVEYVVITATPAPLSPTVPTPIVITTTPRLITPMVVTATLTPVISTPVPTSTDIPLVPVVIAIQDIPAGRAIDASMLEQIMFPADVAPMGSFVDVEDIVGMYAVTDMVREEIILARKITDNPEFDYFRNLDPVIVASHPLEIGEVLDENDISTSFYNTVDFQIIGMYGFDPDTFIMRRTEVLGRSLIQAVGAFQPITTTALSGGE